MKNLVSQYIKPVEYDVQQAINLIGGQAIQGIGIGPVKGSFPVCNFTPLEIPERFENERIFDQNPH